MRKLTDSELEQIDKFIFFRGIHYLDLIQEMRDHMATEIEISDENDFDEALLQVSKRYTPEFFETILRSKTSTLKTKWRRRFWKQILAYFTFPKIALLISLILINVLFSVLINAVCILFGLIAFQILAIRKLKNIRFDELLIAQTFRKQINLFYWLPVLFILFDDYFWEPTHLMANEISIEVITYSAISSVVSICLWATYRHFFDWLIEEVENDYPEYLQKAKS